MRRNTSPAAAPTPTRPAPSQIMASGTSGSGPVDETARPGLSGAPAACGMRVGWDWRALMDSEVGRAGAGVTYAPLAGAWVGAPAALPVSVVAGTEAASAPPAAGTSAACPPKAGAGPPVAAPATVPSAGGATSDAGPPAAVEMPGAGAAAGEEAVAGPDAVGDPGRPGAGDPVGVAAAVVCGPGARGVPEDVGVGAGVAAVPAEAVIAGSQDPGTEIIDDGMRGARVAGA